MELAEPPQCLVQPSGLLQMATSELGLSSAQLGVVGLPPAESWLPFAKGLLEAPSTARCEAQKISQRMQLSLQSETPAALAILASASLLGAATSVEAKPHQDLSQALLRLCSNGCAEPALDEQQRVALASVLWAAIAVIEARDQRSPEREDFWARYGGLGLLPGAPRYNQTFGPDRAYLLEDRSPLYLSASQLAATVERTRWSEFQGVELELETDHGWIVIGGAQDDVHQPSDREHLLWVDLGDDDLYLGAVATNRGGAVSVHVDLGGRDVYSYPQAGADDPGSSLPADSDGRHVAQDRFAGASISMGGGQGGARDGVALLFDLGGEDDRYYALRMSQGYAHQGVGLLFDDGGDDVYRAEAAAQGAAQFGVGLLIDLGAGHDQRSAQFAAQGFG